MTTPLDTAKRSLREKVRARLKTLSPSARTAASQLLLNRLRGQKVWQNAESLLLFAPLADEPDLWPLLDEALTQRKIVTLPGFAAGTNSYTARRILDPARDLETGQFGIREPAVDCPEFSLNHLDLVLVPGVAFDTHGSRLGRGKGFYDRLLAAVRGTKCGVAFEEQIVDTVPVGPLDIPLNCIVTPTRWIET